MKLIKNKKGSPLLSVLITLVAFMVLTWALVVLVGKDMDRGIGAKQLNMLNTYQEGTEILFYVEQAAKYSATQSLLDLAYIGGTSGCGTTSEGYRLWNNKEKVCFPTEGGIMAQLNWRVSSYIKPYLKEFLDTSQNQFMDYELELVQDDKLEISGLPAYTIDLIMPITYKDALLLNDALQEAEVRLGSEVEYYSVSYDYGDYDDFFIGEIPLSSGVCADLANYAKQYIGCPYACGDIAGRQAPYNQCDKHGLTCAGFTNAVAYNVFGFDYRGDGKYKCEHPGVYVVGKSLNDLDVLEPGDIFAANWGSSGSYTEWGHTGIYVDKGYIVKSTAKKYFSGSRTCYMQYTQNSDGDYIFIHSIGEYELGQPGVCYEPAQELFSGKVELISFCRLNQCKA